MLSKGQSLNIKTRPRRNRASENLRNLIAEENISARNLVLPIFVMDGDAKRFEIKSMPGIYRQSLDQILKYTQSAIELGIRSVALFPYIEESKRDAVAKEALNPKGLVPKTIMALKKEFPDLIIFADVALDPFSSHGHDGLVLESGHVDNDSTVELLSKMAVVFGECGADFVAPSDMMDGRVGKIRESLDKANLSQVGILSYSCKYASSFYGPFRDALDSSPKFGDKKTYQMDYRNSREAIREAHLDIEEGADMLMIKPALAYLDIISKVKAFSCLPIAAYNVSGEYSMIKAAANHGWINGQAAMVESLYAIKRAGADIIFTYFAMEMAEYIRKS